MGIEQQVIGHAIDQTGGIDRRFFPGIADIEKHAEYPEEFGADFPDEVKALYEELLTEADGASEEEATKALQQLIRRAQSGREWKDINLDDPSQKAAFAKALKGFSITANAIQSQGDRLALTPDQMGPRQRQLYYENIMNELKQELGLDEDFDRDYLLRLIGDLAFVMPDEIGSLKMLIGKRIGNFDGKISDEMHELLSAFGDREGGTFTGLKSLKEIGNLSVEDYAGLLKMLKPNEIFYLAHLPFVVRLSSDVEVEITAADVTDFLLTEKGIKYFRMHPDERSRQGLSAYIGFLAEKYPGADEGLTLTSRLSRASNDTPSGWKPAEVLDEGHTSLVGLSDPYVRMAENTWNNVFGLAVGIAHTVVNRRRLYPWGANTHLGPELQKSANAYPFYVDRYNNYDAWMRRRFLRLRSLGEYMVDAATWLWPQQKVGADTAKPFEPRLTETVPGTTTPVLLGGVEVVPGDTRSIEDQMKGNVYLLHTFFGVEPDPANDVVEAGVARVMAKAHGFYINSEGKKVSVPPLTGSELIDYAWEIEAEIRNSVGQQVDIQDPSLDTLMRHRTYYPLHPETIKLKLQNINENGRKKLLPYDFKGLYTRLGGVIEPSRSYVGVEGAKLVAEQMGSGIWSMPDWGGSADNYPEKHGGYEQKHLELMAYIIEMAVGSNQSETSELLKAAGVSAVGGHQDTSERMVEGIDEFVSALRGLQGDVKTRVGAIEQFIEAYTKAIKVSPYLSRSRGQWWLYRYGIARAKYLVGIDESPMYLHKGGDNGGQERYEPVLAGEPAAKIHEIFPNPPLAALAVLGVDVNDKDLVYPASAAGFYGMALRKNEKGDLEPHLMKGLGKWYDHSKPIPGSPQAAFELAEEKMWRVLLDGVTEPVDNEVYFKGGHH
jgi:hypothetical protein